MRCHPKRYTDCVASALLDNYNIQLLVINAAGNTLTGFAAAGLTVGPGTFQSIADGTVAAAVDSATAALSVQDFNVFRKRVAMAIDTLDDKITEILNIPRPGC